MMSLTDDTAAATPPLPGATPRARSRPPPDSKHAACS